MTLREYLESPVVEDYIVLDKYFSLCRFLFQYKGSTCSSYFIDNELDANYTARSRKATYHPRYIKGDEAHQFGDWGAATTLWEKGARRGIRQCVDNLIWFYENTSNKEKEKFWRNFHVPSYYFDENTNCKYPEANIIACTNDLLGHLPSVTGKVISVWGDAPINQPIGVPLFASSVETEDSSVTSVPLGVDYLTAEAIDMFIPMTELNEGLMYLNFSLSYPNQRKFSLDRAKAYIAYEHASWATVVRVDARLDYPMSRSTYLQDMYRHKFALCPEGLGISTYRTWEALYMKTIPIVKRSQHMLAFSDLPILFVDDYTTLTPEYLTSCYERMLDQEYNFEKLEFSYWKDIICK